MSRYIIKQKLKSIFSFLIILILFPYIVSVFVNGAQTRLGSAENAPRSHSASDGRRRLRQPQALQSDSDGQG